MTNSNNNSNNEVLTTVRASSDLFTAIIIVFLLGPLSIFIPLPFTGVIWFGILMTMFTLYLYLVFVYEPITENPYQYLPEAAINNSNNSNNSDDSETAFTYQYFRSVVVNLYENVVNFITLIPYLFVTFFQSFSSSTSTDDS